MENLNFRFENNVWGKKGVTKYIGSDREVAVPDDVFWIGQKAFADLDFIDTVVIPDGVTNIDFKAFQNSSISHIVLPPSVSYLGSNIFEGCKNLKTIEIQNPRIEFYKSPFKNAASDFEIIFAGTCDQFKRTADSAYCGQGEYQSGDYHHPSATHFEYYKYIIYEHIFSDTLSTPFTCKVKCIDGQLVYHEMPKKSWTQRI